MKRESMVALGYGLACVVVGVLLVRNAQTVDRGREPDPGSAAVGEGDAMVESGWEIGPDGLRWVGPGRVGNSGLSVGGDGAGGGTTGVEVEGATEAAVPREERGPDGLPLSGRALLAMGDPVVEEVAGILREAGVSELALDGSLRSVYGHVQRLAVFRMLAWEEAARAAELERQAAELNPALGGIVPGMAGLPELWPRRIEDYAGYVKRDLEMRLGISDAAVVGRLAEVGEALAMLEAGLVVMGDGPEPGAQ